MTTGPHICFDIDGTLWESGADLDHDDVSSYLRHTRPIHAALARLSKFMDAGGMVSFITGRSEKVKEATYKQLRTALGDRAVKGIDIFHRPAEPYELMACVLYKLDTLRFLDPDIYVGDLPMDQTAAAAAGVAFMPAEWWAKGHSLEHMLQPDFEPGSLRLRGRRRRSPDDDGLDAVQSSISFPHGAGNVSLVTLGIGVDTAQGGKP